MVIAKKKEKNDCKGRTRWTATKAKMTSGANYYATRAEAVVVSSSKRCVRAPNIDKENDRSSMRKPKLYDTNV